MPRTNCYSAPSGRVKPCVVLCLLAGLLLSASAMADQHLAIGEKLAGFYARAGNDGSPAKTAGNNIYLKFFPDRWVVMLFVPYPYATGVDAGAIDTAFDKAKQMTATASYLRSKFGVLDENATAQIERYGYLEQKIMFECGAMSSCTIKIGDSYLELIKPGVINEHIVRYDYVSLD